MARATSNAMSNDLTFSSATKLAEMIRGKQVSPTEVLDAYIQRIEAVNPVHSAIVRYSLRRDAQRQTRTVGDDGNAFNADSILIEPAARNRALPAHPPR